MSNFNPFTKACVVKSLAKINSVISKKLKMLKVYWWADRQMDVRQTVIKKAHLSRWGKNIFKASVLLITQKQYQSTAQLHNETYPKIPWLYRRTLQSVVLCSLDWPIPGSESPDSGTFGSFLVPQICWRCRSRYDLCRPTRSPDVNFSATAKNHQIMHVKSHSLQF